MKDRLLRRRILLTPGVSAIGVVIVIYLIIGIFRPYPFLTLENQLSLIREISYLSIVCMGMTIVIIGGGIDLSVGSVAGLSGGICASLILAKVGMPLAIIMGLLVGIAVGALNGFLITKFSLSDFMVTLGTMYLFRGAYLAWQRGIPIIGYMNEGLRKFIAGRVIGLPTPFILVVVPLGLVLTFVLTRTQFGSDVFGMGSNVMAAKLVGVKVERVKLIAYVLSGFLSAVGGIVLMARLGSLSPHTGENLEFDVLGAVLLGGTSLAGGRGSIYGSVLGAFIIAIVRNLVVILGVNPYAIQIVVGIIVLFSVGMDRVSRRIAIARYKVLENEA